MLPSLFSESAGSPQMEPDTRSSSPEEITDFSLPEFFKRYHPRLYRGPYLSIRSSKLWTANSDDDDSFSDDSDESELSNEDLRIMLKDPKRRYLAGKRRHEIEWRRLIIGGIPTRKDDLDDWVKDWNEAYFERFWFKDRRRNKENSKLATLDLLAAIRKGGAPYDKFCSLYTPFLKRGEGFDEFNFHFILREFKSLWLLLNKTPDTALEFLQPKRNCVCPFKNHEKWSECFYLNEQIRPNKWRPNPAIMGRIERLAKKDEVLTSFIERHKKGRPSPMEIDDKNYDPRQIHAIFPTAPKDEGWKPRKIQNSFVMLHTTYHICREYERFRNFVPVYRHLPENNLNYIGPEIDSMRVHGIGDVDIQATTPDGKKKGRRIRLFNVRYCPMAPCNAISIPRCESGGIHWDKTTQILYEERNRMRKDIAKVEEHFGFSMLEYKPIDSEGNPGETDT